MGLSITSPAIDKGRIEGVCRGPYSQRARWRQRRPYNACLSHPLGSLSYGTGHPRPLRWQSFFKPGTVGSDGCEVPKCRSVTYIGHFEAHILPLLRAAPSQSCASCEPLPPPLPRAGEGRIVLPRAAPPGAAEDLESRILRRDAGEFERQASGRAARPADHLKLFFLTRSFSFWIQRGP